MNQGPAHAMTRLAPLGVTALLISGSASAQFNNQWVGFADETATRLSAQAKSRPFASTTPRLPRSCSSP